MAAATCCSRTPSSSAMRRLIGFMIRAMAGGQCNCLSSPSNVLCENGSKAHCQAKRLRVPSADRSAGGNALAIYPELMRPGLFTPSHCGFTNPDRQTWGHADLSEMQSTNQHLLRLLSEE